MKKILVTLFNFTVLILISDAALAAKGNIAFAGYSYADDASYGYLGGASAINGDIERDGALLRVSGAYGQSHYTSAAAQNVRNQYSSADLMLGYQYNLQCARITLYGGGNYDNYDINKIDNGNRAAGGKFGAKGQFELYYTPMKQVVVTNMSNYTSAYNAYFSKTSVGWDYGNFVFGPEVAFLGNRTFKQQRFGAGFSEINIGFAALSFSGGYMKSTGYTAIDNGLYATIGLASKF